MTAAASRSSAALRAELAQIDTDLSAQDGRLSSFEAKWAAVTIQLRKNVGIAPRISSLVTEKPRSRSLSQSRVRWLP